MKKLSGIILSILAIFTPVFLSSPTFALDNITGTWSSGSGVGNNLCWSTVCSGYNYMQISPSSDFAGNIIFRYNINGSNATISYPFMSVITPLTFDISNSTVTNFGVSGNSISAGSITVTFSESNPSGGVTPTGTINITENGTFDVTNYASAVVNVDPECEDPRFIQIIVNAFWKYHVYFAGVLVPLIAIFLVYRLIKGRLR